MSDSVIISSLKQINWDKKENREVADQLIADSKEYLCRVIDHIYTGNEIRSDCFMDAYEKQDEIKRLDRRRTVAHDEMLKSFVPFISLLKEQGAFNDADYRLDNRTQIADFVALIAFELIDILPEAKGEGNIRDELAEKIHVGTITFEQISDRIEDEIYNKGIVDEDKTIERVTRQILEKHIEAFTELAK